MRTSDRTAFARVPTERAEPYSKQLVTHLGRRCGGDRENNTGTRWVTSTIGFGIAATHSLTISDKGAAQDSSRPIMTAGGRGMPHSQAYEHLHCAGVLRFCVRFPL